MRILLDPDRSAVKILSVFAGVKKTLGKMTALFYRRFFSNV
ncbi:hypothetical protein HMPREF9996_00952 [Aggregatibacter actinomycetemcomitans Y4]|nr:hypothetical protein HMPREF9996_00952 [Aggregatibacter actinomycetemcomitans Y4]